MDDNVYIYIHWNESNPVQSSPFFFFKHTPSHFNQSITNVGGVVATAAAVLSSALPSVAGVGGSIAVVGAGVTKVEAAALSSSAAGVVVVVVVVVDVATDSTAAG